ncbi:MULTISPECIES: integrase core domain-containing protein [Halomonadaceae]|uniref:Transposase n=1 Tax=Vreelandella halophila TaxID=86177 RepID=A0A9X5B689_9GAMM|nr:transposase [Halomonas utahensis]MYL76057.1 transposase [Halomonas sp. 22501_18_FS]
MIERFFRSLKEECIWQHRFESLAHAQTAIGNWIRYYNEQRPHQSLGYVAPRAHPALVA